MPNFIPRTLAVILALFTGACAALYPQDLTTEQRLAVFPTAGLPIEQPVTIRWNRHQIPYVEAKTDRDLGFALGLVHAHLRLTQIALAKHLTEGRTAELAGPFRVPAYDKALRTLNFRHSAKAIADGLPPETRAYLQSFVDGLNYYQRSTKQLPPEFALLGMGREDFVVEDIIAIGRVAGIDINWFTMINLLRQRDDPRFDEILARTLEAGSGPTVSFDATKTSAFFDLLSSSMRSGSNAFAVSGTRSASGKPMIASDPHLGLSMPNLWVMAGISSPSYRGVGMMIPGTPFLAFGRTPDIAWGGTNMRASHSEYYDVSKLPEDRFVSTSSTVRKRLWFSDETTTRWVKGIGPVMSDTNVMDGAARQGETIALRWLGHEKTDEITAILNASRTKTPQDFRAALKTFALPAQNFVYADAGGHIAQVTATMLPRRSYNELPKTILVDASDPKTAWTDILNPTQLPWVLDPSEGYIASANNKPYADQPNVPVGWFFSADERIRRLHEMLGSDSSVTIDDLKRMQLDTVSPFVRDMMPTLRQMISSVPGARELGAAYVDRLLAFDGDYRVDSAGAPAFETFLYYLAPRVYNQTDADQIPSWLANWEGFGKVFLKDLEALSPERRATIIKEAIALGAKDALPFSTWGQMHRLQISHTLSLIPLAGNRFIYGNFPTAGSRQTVFKSAHGFQNGLHNTRYGSQARHLSDMSDPDANWFILLGGNDGWIGSANFMDQVDLWQKGEYIQMPLRPEAIAAGFPTVMTLSN